MKETCAKQIFKNIFYARLTMEFSFSYFLKFELRCNQLKVYYCNAESSGLIKRIKQC